MENNNMIQVFENSEFGKVRTTMIDGEPWFVAADVCASIGITNRNRAMQNIDEQDKGYTVAYTPGGAQKIAIVNESGIYGLLFQFQPEKAKGLNVPQAEIDAKVERIKRFKRWVTHEVLPSIRKHGAYLTPKTTEELLTNPDLLIELATALKAERAKSAELLAQNIDLKDEVEHKENVIVGLVEDIDLAEKRQRIVQIIRRGCATPGSIKARWALLYTEFEKKYHVNLNSRLERFKSKTIKNRMDVIDKNMNMVPQLFEICCKLYENDYNALMKTWESTIKCVDEPDEDEEG